MIERERDGMFLCEKYREAMHVSRGAEDRLKT